MIKIWGEAKSATKYLQALIERNTDADLAPTGSPWKHGFPQPSDCDDVFLMRDVSEWVKSYLADPSDSRYRGLKEPFGEVWGHLLEARTAKYLSYINYIEKYGGMLIKTEYLKQHPGCLKHLRVFGYRVGAPVRDIDAHMRLGIRAKDNPDRRPLTKGQKHFIRSNIDPEIERFVGKLQLSVRL